MSEPKRQRGTIKNIVHDRGFAFIDRGDGQPDLFFHMSAAPSWDQLSVGDPVSFEERQNDRNGKAQGYNVELVEE